jgi:cell division protein FtsZ
MNNEEMKFQIETVGPATIKVIGVGGCGGNTLNTMIRTGMSGVDFIACNTDRMDLESNMAPTQLILGEGLGAGGDPDKGRLAAEESSEAIVEMLKGSHMVFITAGLGGGTGTGAGPVIARLAKEVGALTVAIVTRPFTFEGNKRISAANQGLETLNQHVDSLITIPNQKLLAWAGNGATMKEAFSKSDEVLLNAVQGISDLITVPGLINLDFADVKTIMEGMGAALMGTGVATGEGRALEAANMAISHPLLEDVQINGARGVLINITGPQEMGLAEVQDAVSHVQEAASDDANIIFGTVFDDRMGDAMRITVIATGFPGAGEKYVPDARFDQAPAAIGGRERGDVSIFPSNDGHRQSIAPRSGARRVVHMGSVSDIEKDKFGDPQTGDPGDRPVFRNGPSRISSGKSKVDMDDYETPTYIRRSAD